MNSETNRTKSICTRFTEAEHSSVTQKAKDMNVSLNTYMRKCALNDASGCRMQLDQIMQLMPVLYTAMDEVDDPTVRQKLKELGGRLCQYLK